MYLLLGVLTFLPTGLLPMLHFGSNFFKISHDFADLVVKPSSKSPSIYLKVFTFSLQCGWSLHSSWGGYIVH